MNNQLNETLEGMKGQKLPSSTLFGKLNGLVPDPYQKFKTLDNPGYPAIPYTGIDKMGKRLAQYGRFLSKLTTVKALLADLSHVLAGSNILDLEEGHDCQMKLKGYCRGCETVAEVLAEFDKAKQI